jgi:HD-GYP domain-containing protein (c-di-GMP phosphodiesterase class II)
MADILQKQLDVSEVFIPPELEKEENFEPVPLRNLIVGQKVPFDVFLKIKNKGQLLPQFVKCCDWGEVFQEEWHQKLRRLRIPWVYVFHKDGPRVLQYLQQHLEQVLADDTLSELETGVLVCDTAHIWASNFFSNQEARTREQVRLARQFLDTLLEVIKGDRQNILHLLNLKSHKDLRLFTHCLNVSLLGMAFTSYLRWSPEKVRGFGLGALVHDIGLNRTSRAILDKKGKLTADEMFEIKRHPIDGFRQVQAFIHLRWEALQMVLQHHENGDGTGYPEGLKLSAIHSWARILRILDSYEAMTAKRPWRAAMNPKEALWTMRNDWQRSNLFDPHYLKAFIKFLASR